MLLLGIEATSRSLLIEVSRTLTLHAWLTTLLGHLIHTSSLLIKKLQHLLLLLELVRVLLFLRDHWLRLRFLTRHTLHTRSHAHVWHSTRSLSLHHLLELRWNGCEILRQSYALLHSWHLVSTWEWLILLLHHWIKARLVLHELIIHTHALLHLLMLILLVWIHDAIIVIHLSK